MTAKRMRSNGETSTHCGVRGVLCIFEARAGHRVNSGERTLDRKYVLRARGIEGLAEIRKLRHVCGELRGSLVRMPQHVWGGGYV